MRFWPGMVSLPINESVANEPTVEHVVILIQTIRSDGRWMQKVQAVMQSDTMRVALTKYGGFPVLRFLLAIDSSGRPVFDPRPDL
jgi:hypothetical protein